MTRLVAVLALMLALLGGAVPLAVVRPQTRLQVPAGLLDPSGLPGLTPFRGASRDRSLSGKARRRARRAAA